MSTDALFLAIRVCAIAGLLLLALAVCVHLIRRAPARPAVPAVRPPYRQCDTTTCGHMATAHDRSPAGLVCRGCGATRSEAL